MQHLSCFIVNRIKAKKNVMYKSICKNKIIKIIRTFRVRIIQS